jgi:hypothetical protein
MSSSFRPHLYASGQNVGVVAPSEMTFIQAHKT